MTSRQQEYHQPAASRGQSSHVGSVAQGSGRGDRAGKVEPESENTPRSGPDHSPWRPSGARGEHRGGRGGRRGGRSTVDSIEALGRCM